MSRSQVSEAVAGRDTASTILDVVRNRRSVRKYRPDAMSPDEIAALKMAVIWAPSAGNLHSRRFFFVTGADPRVRLARAAPGSEFIGQAPLVIVGCEDRHVVRDYLGRGFSLYAVQDVAAAVENVLLVAHALGLGACWVGMFNEAEVHSILGLPQHLRPVALVPVGRPAEAPDPPERPAPEEIVRDVS
jgi:nitroreductase